MAKIDIIFNDIKYSVEESSFVEAAAKLQSHLSTAMSGSGSVITFGGISYNIDSEKLSNYTDDFVSHLGEIAGGDSKVVVNGVEYFIDSAKVQDAVAGLETVLGNLNSGSEMPPEEPVDKYSWEAVFASIDAGTYATDYAIGDCVPLDLGSEGLINMQIAAFDADDLADGSGKAPITWIAKELLKTKQRMGAGDYDDTGWQGTELRSYLKNTIKPMIPQTVRNAIVDVSKQSVTEPWTEYGVEDVWLPSYYGEIASGTAGWKYQSLFPDDASKAKCIVGETTAIDWWSRSCAGFNSFYCVRTDWRPATVRSNKYYGVCLCFCT